MGTAVEDDGHGDDVAKVLEVAGGVIALPRYRRLQWVPWELFTGLVQYEQNIGESLRLAAVTFIATVRL